LSEKDEGWMEWISSHSMSSARAERLKKELASQPRQGTIPFSFEWAGSIG
jgi:beta-barrel assembly-enhancing protease